MSLQAAKVGFTSSSSVYYFFHLNNRAKAQGPWYFPNFINKSTFCSNF